jgi:Xaa-Pro aminopeptidase
MSHAPTGALERRHQAVRKEAAGLDALVVTSLPNVLYLTNFTGSAAIAVVTADRLHFLTDFRYATTVNETRGSAVECPALELTVVDGSYDVSLTHLLASLPAGRIGFEAAHLTVSRHRWLTDALARQAPSHELVPTEGVVERTRARKDPYEIATLREAARRLSLAVRPRHRGAARRSGVHQAGL